MNSHTSTLISSSIRRRGSAGENTDPSSGLRSGDNSPAIEGRAGHTNGSRYPVQEGLETCCPFQETEQESVTQRPVMQENRLLYHQGDAGNEAPNFSVQETGQPNMPPCHQPINDDQINSVSSINQSEQPIEYACNVQELKLWIQQLNRSKAQKATRSKGNTNGSFFIMEITEINQHLRYSTPIFSPAVYTDTYEWKLGIRIYLSGVEDGSGRDVAVFVHMIKGEYDDLLDWPFPERITISFLDQSGESCRNHISRIIQAKPTLRAFQKPNETICSIGYGFVKFTPVATLFSQKYLKDDKLFLKIEFSP